MRYESKGPARALSILAALVLLSCGPRHVSAQQADRILLNAFSPAGVIINRHLEVLQFRGRTSPYLEHAHGEASLNLQTNRTASHPFIFSGSVEPGKAPAPWVAWEETSINSNATQIFVAKGVKDDSQDPKVIGGFHWEPVGLLKASEPTLNVDPFRNSSHATGVFAETANDLVASAVA